jgi:hypothetical protein
MLARLYPPTGGGGRVNGEYELQIAQDPDYLQPVSINEAIVRG